MDVGGDLELGHGGLDDDGCGLVLLDGHLHVRHFLAALDQLEGEHIPMLLHQGLHPDRQLVVLLPLRLGEEVQQFQGGGDELVRAGEDRVLAEINPGLLHLQALLGG